MDNRLTDLKQQKDALKEQLEKLDDEFASLQVERNNMYKFEKVLALFIKCNSAFADEVKCDENGLYIVYNGQLAQNMYDSMVMNNNLTKVVYFQKGSKKAMQTIEAVLGPLTYVDDTKYAYIGTVVDVECIRDRNAGDRKDGHPQFKIYLDVSKLVTKIADRYYECWPTFEQCHFKLKALLKYGIEPLPKQKVDQGFVMCQKRVT